MIFLIIVSMEMSIKRLISLSYRVNVRVLVFNVTFNNISVISWQSVLLVEETVVPGENHVLTCRMSLTNFIT